MPATKADPLLDIDRSPNLRIRGSFFGQPLDNERQSGYVYLMTNTDIAVQLTSLSKMYSQRGNKNYASALRRQAGQALKGVEGNWSSIISNAQNGL